MELRDSHINTIKDVFGQMQTQEDLLSLLNYAKPFVYGENTKPFSLKQLTYYAYAKGDVKRYSAFTVKKKSGGSRTIHAPVNGLKAIQKALALVLQCVFEPHAAAKGFVQGRSIVDNAKIHVGNHYVYNIDLKDFFPNIEQGRVWKCLQLKPFNLVNEENKSPQLDPNVGIIKIYNINTSKSGIKYINSLSSRKYFTNGKNNLTKGWYALVRKRKSKGIILETAETRDQLIQKIRSDLSKYKIFIYPDRIKICNIIASLCCTEMKVERINEDGIWEKVKRNVLPQGAPTSPVLTNVVCQRLDYLLTGVAKRFGLQYSRYADDITFSSQHNVYQQDSEFIKELHRIISEQGFHIKESKVRLQKQGYRQEVTGLIVNEKVNVSKRYVKQLRQWLYYWERYGYERFNAYFLPLHLADKGHIYYFGKPDMANVLAGKLDYLKMVKGEECMLYKKLKDRFDKLLTVGTKTKLNRETYLGQILNAIFDKGLSTAMELYSSLDKYT